MFVYIQQICVGFLKGFGEERKWQRPKKHSPDIMQVGFSNAPYGDEERWDSCEKETHTNLNTGLGEKACHSVRMFNL